eukprot:7388468-Prymnesium_polylepis.1
MVAGRLDKGGRKGSAILKQLGVKISMFPLFHAARAHVREERAVTRSLVKTCSGALPAEFMERLRNW